MSEIYLDNAATTPLSAEVAEAMAPYQGERWGNPSSVHRRGVKAREAIDRARAQVARAVGAKPELVLFTGSGTEANNLAILGILRAQATREGNIWIGPTEHPSVRATAEAASNEGWSLNQGVIAPDGTLDLQQLEQSLSSSTRLVAQMLVSNEFGTIYPISKVASCRQAQAPDAWLHVDAIQALGKLSVTMSELGADSLSLSAHKIHGPQGVGALICSRKVELQPLIFGGGQEFGIRSGTENLASIVGFGCAAELANEERLAYWDRLVKRRTDLVTGLKQIQGLRVLEAPKEASQQPGILSLVVPGAPAEVWLHHLDAGGIIVSVGSACQASKKEISPTLLATGLDAESARQVLRVSLGTDTSPDDIQTTLSVFGAVARELGHL